ncbi:MAG: MFS transporter [Anaerolineae bacterium]
MFISVLSNGRTETDSLSETTQKYLRRNYLLGLLNGATFNFVEALLDPALVLTWFVSQLTSSHFLIGLVVPISTGVALLPQLLFADFLERQERKLPLYQTTAVVRGLSWFLLFLSLFFLGQDSNLLLVAFFSLFTLSNLAAGPAALAFMDVVGKVIPARRRGSFFGARLFIGGMLAVGGSLVVRYILDERSGFPFPRNYAMLFLIYFLGVSAGMASFCLVVEPANQARAVRISFLGQLVRAWDMVRNNANYRFYLIAALALTATDVAASFYIVYAKNVLGASGAMVGVYLTVYTASSVLSNLVWGWLNDRHGSVLVIRTSCLIALCAPAFTLASGPLTHLPRISKEAALYLFTLIFALFGAFKIGRFMGTSNFILDLAPSQERPMYLGLTNTMQGLVLFGAASGGLIVDIFGLETVFYIALAFCLIASFLSLCLKEPRDGE